MLPAHAGGNIAGHAYVPADPYLSMTDRTDVALDSEIPRIAARVLLVEDNLVNVEMAKAILEQSGLQVHVAMSGSEAVSSAAAGQFDMILMDIQLPDFDGYEAARRIRAEEAPGRRTPIVAMSGTLGPDVQQRCNDAGIDGYEEKPLTSALLARLASRWLVGNSHVDPCTPRSLSPERLARLFRESAARLIADLQRGHRGGDRDAMMRAAHTLKSISARVSAGDLSKVCADLEAATRNAQPADLGPAVASVLGAYAALDASLRGEVVAPLRKGQVATPAAQSAPLVLVVDDEENERFLVRRMLEHAGYHVDECDCGQAALAYCRNRRPDIVLLDGLMPGMDGIATCQALRADFPPEDLPIVIFTGLDDPEWRVRALQAGADSFVEKSVGIAELVGGLRAALTACGLESRRR